MFGYLLILFTVVPAIELMLLIQVGGVIGAGNTLMLIIFTGVVGAYLARMQGFLAMQKIQQEMNAGRMPTAQMLDGVMILVGGFVLLTPGFVTDALGLLLLFPLTREIIKFVVRKQIERMIKEGKIVRGAPRDFYDQGRPTGFMDVDGHSVD